MKFAKEEPDPDALGADIDEAARIVREVNERRASSGGESSGL